MKLKLAKTFLVLNFMLIMAVAIFSFFLFSDREVIKASTLLSLETIEDTAQNLAWGGEVGWESEADRKKETFILALPGHKDQLADFQTRLQSLAAFASLRVEQLEQQFATLEETRETLAQVRAILAERTQELADTRDQIAQRKVELADLEDRLEEANATLADLERQKIPLEREIQDLEQQVSEKDAYIAKLEAVLSLRTEERDLIQTLYEACEGRGRSGGMEEGAASMAGVVLAVDHKWNFAIINRGEVDVLPMFSQAFVHRGDTYVGKLLVRQVEHGVALAEIMTETFEPGISLEVGDTLFFDK